jgi:hypothetical protein
VAVGDRVDQFRALARQALADLFDQREPFGRLALVQVLMLAGDTLVTISLAGSLFFSISPDAAKGKVLLYLVLTLAPFAVVSPMLGPLIDRSRGARRAMAVLSAAGRCALCPLMASDTHSLLLFPEAFFILVLSKLYLVTRGALVPEMAAAAGSGAGRWAAPHPPPAAPGAPAPGPVGFAGLNARLTLLGTVAGFVASVPGVILLKLAGAPGVLVFDAFVFLAAAGAAFRLPVPRRRGSGGRAARTGPARGPDEPEAAPAAGEPPGLSAPAGAPADGWDRGVDRDLAHLQPAAHPEVLLGLSTMSLIRGLAGFLVFLLAFGLRREHAALWWYGLALGGSGVGAICGLLLVGRLRQWLAEWQILLGAVWLIALGALGAAVWGTIPAQAALALVVGVAGSLAQPSFDAMTQRLVPPAAQGRTFARFATRQQLVWVVGALIPVVVAFPFPAGDVVMAVAAGAGGLFYMSSRRALRHRAVPRYQAQPED